MERRPTIVDVARVAGVSKSTVSLVLQTSPLVRAETRVAVHRVMQDLGYVYNRAAATLRKANAGLIGLVINDLRNPFFTEFATSAQMAFSARGYATVVANTDEDPALQAQVVGAMIEHGIAGLVISPAYGDVEATFGPIARAGVPALQVLRRVEEAGADLPFASPDFARGSRLAAEHLIAAGCRRIAFAGGVEGRSVTRARMAGYLAVLAEAGMAPLVLPGRPTRSYGREVARTLATDHPGVDGLICFNDLVALGVLSGSAEIGRRIGTDLRVIGFDDIEDCSQVFPALSSVSCGIAGFGRAMAATLLDWIEEGRRPPAETVTPVELILRASSRP